MNIDTVFEKVGIKYFEHLSDVVQNKNYTHISDLPDDKIMQIVSKNTMLNTIIIAFMTGALTTIPSVMYEITYYDTLDTLEFFISLSIITLAMLFIELFILYWITLRAVYTISSLVKYEDLENNSSVPIGYKVENILVRSALEIDDPAINYLGINLEKNISKKMVLFTSLLYKAKEILSAFVLKMILKKGAGRFASRVSIEWVAIPVTAFWDAYTVYDSIQEAKIRLFGYKLSHYITQEILTEKLLNTFSSQMRLMLIRSVASVVVLANHYHPNNLLLLARLSENLHIKKEDDYDNWDKFQSEFEKLDDGEKDFIKALTTIAASFDGKLSKKEKELLPYIFQDDNKYYFTQIKTIIKLLEEGRLHKVANLSQELLIPKDRR